MYSFSDPNIKMLIQELPGAKFCAAYEWRDFGSLGGQPAITSIDMDDEEEDDKKVEIKKTKESEESQSSSSSSDSDSD